MSIQEELSAFLKNHIDGYDPKSYNIEVEVITNGMFELKYYTDDWHSDWNDKCCGMPLLKILADKPYCEKLLKLRINAEDAGINGTQNWELEGLLNNKNNFVNLTSFELPLNSLENHNRIIVSFIDSYEENNGIGLLLDKCPRLTNLIIPSAPGEKFFDRKEHVLENLIIQTGYDHQNFIKNLSKSTCFKSLKHLSFRDYAETYMDDFKKSCTQFDDYLLLMTSSNLPALNSITLIDTVIDQKQKDKLIIEASNKGVKLNFESINSL